MERERTRNVCKGLNNKIEDLLPDYFQSKIRIVLEGKDVITGRLILYSMRGFNFVLMMKLESGRITKIVFPRPFHCTKYDGKIVCDYRFSTLAQGNSEVAKKLKAIKVYETSKYMDKVAEIIHKPPQIVQ